MSKKTKRTAAEKALARKEMYLKNNEKLVYMHRFPEKFMLCEICCKAILKEYKKNNGTYTSDPDIKLHMRDIPAAMKFAGYSMDDETLSAIFAGSGDYTKRGSKSAKKLRDAIMHNLSEADIDEVSRRFFPLCAVMDSFLDHFRREAVQPGEKTAAHRDAA